VRSSASNIAAGALRLVERLAPCHLLHQEGAGHGGVALGVDRHAAQFAQIGGAPERILQALVRLVDAHRPLHRHALAGGAMRREAVGMDFGLQGAPARIEHGRVLALAPRQAEQREVVVVELHS
jgi:hypothetical protein